MTLTTNDENERPAIDVLWWVQQITIGIATAVGIFYGFSWILGSV